MEQKLLPEHEDLLRERLATMGQLLALVTGRVIALARHQSYVMRERDGKVTIFLVGNDCSPEVRALSDAGVPKEIRKLLPGPVKHRGRLTRTWLGAVDCSIERLAAYCAGQLTGDSDE